MEINKSVLSCLFKTSIILLILFSISCNQEENINKKYFENGQLKQVIHYNDNGQKDGWTVLYYPNGNIRGQIYYENGRRDSTTNVYYENGSIRYKFKFYKATKESSYVVSNYETSYASVRTTKSTFTDGSYKFIEYHKNGFPKVIKTFKDNKLNGNTKYFYENGIFKKIEHYKNGKLEGKYKVFNKKGELSKVLYYRKDSLINEKEISNTN